MKGKDIFTDLGLAVNSLELDDFLSYFSIALQLVETNLQNADGRDRMQEIDLRATEFNEVVLDQVEKMESEEIDAKEIIAILLSYKERYCISV